MSDVVIVLIKSDELSYNISRNKRSTIIIINVGPTVTIPFDEFTSVLAVHRSCEIHWNFMEIPEITKKFRSMVGLVDVAAPSITKRQQTRAQTFDVRQWGDHMINHMEENGAYPDFWSRNKKIQQKCINYIRSALGEPIDIAHLTEIYQYVRDNYEE